MKKILGVLLTLIMVIAMMPWQISAATDLTWNGGTITLASETKVGSYVLNTLAIYKQGATSNYPEIISATQDGNTINITLSEGTDLSYPIQMGFAGTGGSVQHSGNTCTLKNGKGTATVSIIAKPAPVPNAPVLGSDTFTVNFSVELGEVYDVTFPMGQGFTFDGELTAGKNQDYSFKVNINEGYDGSDMVVKVNKNEITANNGVYTVTDVTEGLAITVEGVVKKTVYTVTLTEGEGYTLSGQATSYANEPYTFSVLVDDTIYWADKIKVLVDGEKVTLTNGKYTFDTLDGNKNITVENVLEREILTVTKPEVEGVTISGDDTVRDSKPYTFTITIDEKYDGTNMVVAVNGTEITPVDNRYTVNIATEDIAIQISGVVKKDICEIIKPADGKFTFTFYYFIANLYEFDCGELSGWMYKVNNWFPNYGCSRYQLKAGDKVEWVYTCDLGVDVGGNYSARNGN